MAALTKAPGEVIIDLINETFCSDILYQLIKKKKRGNRSFVGRLISISNDKKRE